MRARLLDMGEVGAVRSQSLVRAVVAALDSASSPVVLLVKPFEPVVSVGSRPTSASVDLDFCRVERIPVVRSAGAEIASFHAPSHLLLHLLIPEERVPELGLGVAEGWWPETAARPLLSVCRQLAIEASVGEQGRIEVDGRCLARVALAPLPGAVGVSWELFVGSDREALETEARALAGLEEGPEVSAVESLVASRTAFDAELVEPAGLGQIADALIEAVETTLDLELVPSMPTPDEMDAVYEWDERILVSELLDDPERGAGLNTYLM